MKRALVLLFALLSSAAHAQSIPFPGPGMPAVTYTGPGDVVSFAWWGGFRAYSAATAGTKAIRIVRASDSTQTDINTLSDGTFDAASATSFCNATSCKVVTIYDKVGTTDVTQATDANRPTLTASALGTSYCMTVSGSQYLASSGTYTQSQPYTGVVVAKQSSTVGDQGMFAIMNAGFTSGFTMNALTTSGNYNAYAGSNTNTTVTSSNWNSFISVFNGASTVNNINGSENTVSPGTQSISALTVNFGRNQGNQTYRGLLCEAGFIAATLSAGNRTSLNSNMHGAYGGF